jgi:GTP diphosphokinase / guanosine-3',5'-bis(diphosphate) 3'-diphosphatase
MASAAKINFNDEEINRMQKFFNLKTSQELFMAFQDGTLDTGDLRRYIESKSVFNNLLNRLRKPPTKNQLYEETAETNFDMIVFGKDEEKMNYSFANCEEIF